jgi:phosphonate transport system ATP-binding protein
VTAVRIASLDGGQRHPMLSFQNAGKRFAGGVAAVDSVSFEVPRGQFCVLLGPSGAGKSTLLRMVNGLVEPSAGKVLVDGHAVGRQTLPAIRRKVAMVHQQFNLVERMDVAQNVLSGAVAAAARWRIALAWYPQDLRRKCCALVERVGLRQHHLNRRVAELSGGEQQRVGIARAFILDPDVILADEPVASLDPATSRDVLQLLHDAARERGATVFCSLHQIDLAQAFADRIVAMRAGRVVFDGRPENLDREQIDLIYEGVEAGARRAVA